MIDEKKVSKTKEPREIKLKSDMYNHNSEKIIKREKNDDIITWGFVIGFILFIVIIIMMVTFVR